MLGAGGKAVQGLVTETCTQTLGQGWPVERALTMVLE